MPELDRFLDGGIWTWERLSDEGLDDPQAADLMAETVVRLAPAGR